MKTRIALAACVLALLAAGVAWAGYDSGAYTGKTKVQKLAVSFRATQSRLSQLKMRVKFTCTDGDSFTTALPPFGAQNIVSGRYDASFEGTSKASTYRHKGRILNQTATGSLTGIRHYDDQNRLDPKGTIICRTGTIRYSIKKHVPKRR